MASTRLLSTLIAAGLIAATTSAAHAAYGHYSPEQQMTRFIYYYQYLYAGTTYTIETTNLTTGGDTVMHLLGYDGAAGTYVQVAADDDGGTGLASRIVYTPSVTGGYRILVRSYSGYSSGNADLYINGALKLSQNQFGGERRFQTWNAQDEFRTVATRRGYSNDLMMFLLSTNTQVAQFDDDSGPKLYPQLDANTNETGSAARVVWGLYPGSSGYARMIHQDKPFCALGYCGWIDSDLDGLTNDLETLVGTNPGLVDSDDDMVPDGYETFGTNDYTWSFSEDGHPAQGDLFVEIDYMTGAPDPADNTQPYGNLASDVEGIFQTDGGVNIHVVVDDGLAWTEQIEFGSCGGTANCVDFYNLKASSFDYPNSYFHYTMFAFKRRGTCSSGVAEILGNDVIVSLGCFSNTQAQQRGTFVHELGHNLNLSHNGNGNNNGNNSTIHESVMNYRYQLGGIPGTNRHTYSDGANACASCWTSPKQGCIDLKNAGQCGTVAGATCDCDVTEWNGAVELDFYEGSQWADGAGSVTLAADSRVAAGNPGKLAGILDAQARRLPAVVERAEDLRLRAAAKVDRLIDRGLVEGRDFSLSDDGTRVISICE